MTCFEQAAPHGGVLCSQQFRDALVASSERPTGGPAASAATAPSSASAATAAASSTGAAGLKRIFSLGFFGAPSPSRDGAGPQGAALCPVVRHKGLSAAAPLRRAGGDVALPLGQGPPSGQAVVDLAPVTLTSYTHRLEGDPSRSTDLDWASFASLKLVSGAFSALASPLLPALLGSSPAPFLAARSSSVESVNAIGGDAGPEVSFSRTWRPTTGRMLRPSLDARAASPDHWQPDVSFKFPSQAHPEVRGPPYYAGPCLTRLCLFGKHDHLCGSFPRRVAWRISKPTSTFHVFFFVGAHRER